MKTLYKGPIHKMYVKKLEISDPMKQKQLANSIVKKDALFYRNYLGKIISFDFDTVLPDQEEAIYYVSRSVENGCKQSCTYFNEDELKPYAVSNEEFKNIKAKYKIKRKND